MYCQHVETPAVFGFVNYDYRSKSVATQIPYDAELTPIPYTDRKSSPTGDRTSVSFRITNLNLVNNEAFWAIV